ncbi:MAG: RND transporter [Planctomycetaceae bacterium]|nr:RND transporter [Planctomycetaceae bacterium]
MSAFLLKRTVTFGVLLALTAMATGCGQKASDQGSAQVSEASHEEHAEGDGHDHGGWWCGEHGVPEEECSVCSTKAADGFKAKGDWCDEHNRAESQCFKCDPSRAEKFAKLYAAKFGHQPPKPTE